MESIKISQIKDGDVVNAKRQNSEYLVQLKDGKWYILIRDVIQADAQGGALMGLIRNLADKHDRNG